MTEGLCCIKQRRLQLLLRSVAQISYLWVQFTVFLHPFLSGSCTGLTGETKLRLRKQASMAWGGECWWLTTSSGQMASRLVSARVRASLSTVAIVNSFLLSRKTKL